MSRTDQSAANKNNVKPEENTAEARKGVPMLVAMPRKKKENVQSVRQCRRVQPRMFVRPMGMRVVGQIICVVVDNIESAIGEEIREHEEGKRRKT